MKKILLLLLAISFISCQKNDLKSEFNCKSSTSFSDTKEIRDVMKKFKIKFPSNWKTQLYYDEFQSEIYSADTTKSLTDTYILDISWHQGELNLNEAFDQSVKDTLAKKEKLSPVKTKFIKFKEKPSYFNLSKGKSGNHTYHFLQVYVKTEVDEYFTFTTKVYGDENVDGRLCEAIQLSDEIVFIE
ncbi:MAG: hypothetical protein L3J20_11035 [Flavobacteriaceae bacterium]|nr:hypothetical protein [Flavobacteriaceae bacterium]